MEAKGVNHPFVVSYFDEQDQIISDLVSAPDEHAVREFYAKYHPDLAVVGVFSEEMMRDLEAMLNIARAAKPHQEMVGGVRFFYLDEDAEPVHVHQRENDDGEF